MRPLTNSGLAELLARASDRSSGTKQRALKRAGRAAFGWPEAASVLLARGGDLTELYGVGPFIAREMRGWIEASPTQRLIVPAIRRDFLTVADARVILAGQPSWASRLRGDLQMHTNWSDGSETVQEMADAVAARRYEYIGITDHSKGLKIAGGIDEAALLRQADEIERVNTNAAVSGVTVLRSVEMNLNPRGEGDMDPASLCQLDLVLGAFHSALRTEDDQTDRYLAAVRNPNIQILAHPRGRIYNYRLGLTADWPRVFAEAARLDKAVEIDSYPDRQDLNVKLLRVARAAGVRISLGTDAHHASQLSFIELGLAAALRARISAERIVNFMPLPELRQWVANVRERAGWH